MCRPLLALATTIIDTSVDATPLLHIESEEAADPAQLLEGIEFVLSLYYNRGFL